MVTRDITYLGIDTIPTLLVENTFIAKDHTCNNHIPGNDDVKFFLLLFWNFQDMENPW